MMMMLLSPWWADRMWERAAVEYTAWTRQGDRQRHRRHHARPIDTEMVYHGQNITLIDTAGIRRRGRVEPGIEKYSVLRSMRSIDRADVALILIDGVEGVTAQDAHIAGHVLEAHKSVVVLVNKWDIVEKNTQTMVEYTRKVRQDLKFLDYVPVLFISALTKQRVQRCCRQHWPWRQNEGIAFPRRS